MKELDGTPRPHYLKSVGELALDGRQLKGLVVFPSTDTTISDRIDHVNVAHHLFAVWNAAHLMCKQAGLQHPRAFETVAKSLRPTAPDEQINIEVKAKIERENSGKINGALAATFTDKGHKTLCEVNVRFVARRQQSA